MLSLLPRAPLLLSVALALACAGGGTGVDAPLADADGPAPPMQAPSDAACDTLTGSECLASTRCVLAALEQSDVGYECRPAASPCEEGLAQNAEDFADACAARPGCVHSPARCFCPPAQTRVPAPDENGPQCFCGGGPPQGCVAAP